MHFECETSENDEKRWSFRKQAEWWRKKRARQIIVEHKRHEIEANNIIVEE